MLLCVEAFVPFLELVWREEVFRLPMDVCFCLEVVLFFSVEEISVLCSGVEGEESCASSSVRRASAS